MLSHGVSRIPHPHNTRHRREFLHPHLLSSLLLNNSKVYMYFANHCVVFVLFVLLCSAYLSIDCATCSPITMGNFDITTIHTNYDLKEELDLVSYEYVMPDEDNIELLSSSLTDLNVLQLNIRGLLNKQD